MASRAEIDMMESLHLIKINFIELNKKFESLLEIIRINLPVEPVEQVLNCRHPDHIWSIEFKDNLVIIKYHYNKDFAEYIRKLCVSLYWDKYLLGWVAEKDFHQEIYFQILEKFPEWECIDKR